MRGVRIPIPFSGGHKIRIGKRDESAKTYLVEPEDDSAGQIFSGLTKGREDKLPAPIASISVGSAGLKRSRKWLNAMYAAGCTDRIQSVLIYDCNQTTIADWATTQSERSAAFTVLPMHVMLSDGFIRNAESFQTHYATIEKDLERMVDDMADLSHEAGTYPQIILEWLGFGGHAQLSYMLHDIVEDRFPNATFLPIYCLPDENVLETKMREYLWDKAMQTQGQRVGVLTDNASTKDFSQLDSKLAVALAAVESGYKATPEGGTLAELTGMMSQTNSRWLGVAEHSLPLRIEDNQLVVGRDENTLHEIKTMIWNMAAPDSHQYHLADHTTGTRDIQQRIYVAIPVPRDIIMDTRNEILDQLRREDFDAAYPGTRVIFAPANFRQTSRDGTANAHVTKIFEAGDDSQPSLRRILEPGYQCRRRRGGLVVTRGMALLQAEETERLNGHQELESTAEADHESVTTPIEPDASLSRS